MANNKSIQILRGTRGAIINNSNSQSLLDGQLLYNSTDNYLTVGGGGNNDLTKDPIACKELKGFSTPLAEVGGDKREYDYTISGNSDNKGLFISSNNFNFNLDGNNSIAIGGVKFDSPQRPPTSAEGKQAIAIGGSSQAFGNWSASIGMYNETYQNATMALGGGCVAGMTKDEFNKYWGLEASIPGWYNEYPAEVHFIPRYYVENSTSTIYYCSKLNYGLDSKGKYVEYTSTLNDETIKIIYAIYNGKFSYSIDNGGSYNNPVIYYEDSGREYERSAGLAFAANSSNTVHGKNSAVFGDQNKVYGKTSTSFGQKNVISKDSPLSFIMGYGNEIDVNGNSTIFGSNNKNYGSFNTIFGTNNVIQNKNTNVFVAGDNLNTALQDGTLGSITLKSLFGQYNEPLNADDLFVIGNGESETNRSNAFEVKSDSSLKLSMLSAKGQPEITDAKKPQATGIGAIAFGGFRGDKPTGKPNSLPTTRENENIDNPVDDTTSLAAGIQSAVFGAGNRAWGNWDFVAGKDNVTFGKSSFAFGNGNIVGDKNKNDEYSFAFAAGTDHKLPGKYASAFGEGNTVESVRGTAFGHTNTLYATAINSFTSGYLNRAQGEGSATFGNNNINDADYTLGGGANTIIGTNTSGAIIYGSNLHTRTTTDSLGTSGGSSKIKALFGQYNDLLDDDVIFAIGNGTSSTEPSTAFIITESGKVKLNNTASINTSSKEVVVGKQIAVLDCTNKLGTNSVLTELSQTNGQIDYTVTNYTQDIIGTLDEGHYIKNITSSPTNLTVTTDKYSTVGSEQTPVYRNTNGELVECGFSILNAYSNGTLGIRFIF